MKFQKMIIIVLSFCFILSLTTVAAANSKLVIGLDPDWKTFDPGRAYEMYANMVFNGTYDNLVKFEGQEVVTTKSLAKDYTISGDGLTYTFKLRDGVKFVSGNKLSAKDVKWSFDRVKNLKGNPAFLAENIASTETPDESTVVVKLKAPDASFLSKIATSSFAVVDSVAVTAKGGVSGEGADKTDKADQWLNSHSEGSGPYILAEFTPDARVVLKKNPNYWQKVPGADEIVLSNMKDANSQLLTLRRGDVDIAFNINAEHVKQLAGLKDVKVMSSQTKAITFLLMNMDPEVGGPVSNNKVQNAIRKTLDYEGLRIIAGSNAVSPYSIIQKGFLGAMPPKDKTFTNIEEAKKLMAEAGYPDGFEITFDVATYAMEGVKWVVLGEKIASDLARIGIKAKIRTSDLMVGLDQYRKGNQAFSLWGWNPDYPDPNNQLAFVAGQKVGHRARWKAEHNPELVELQKKTVTETNDQKRAELLQEIQKITATNGPWCVFLQFGRQYGVRANIEGADYGVYLLELDQIIKK